MKAPDAAQRRATVLETVHRLAPAAGRGVRAAEVGRELPMPAGLSTIRADISALVARGDLFRVGTRSAVLPSGIHRVVLGPAIEEPLRRRAEALRCTPEAAIARILAAELGVAR